MTPDEQKALVIAGLAKRERIANDTRVHLEELGDTSALDPLSKVDPAIRRAAEDEYFAAKGRHRYETSDGRTLYLTAEEIALRRRTRANRADPDHAGRNQNYGPTGDQNRWWLTWGFNAMAVILALAVVYVILH